MLKIRVRHDYCCRIDFDFGDSDDDANDNDDDDNDDYDDGSDDYDGDGGVA